MERGIPTEFEAFYPAPLNVWFKVVARPYEGGIIIFSSDITARKKAEARRDAITRQLQQVFDATTDAIVGISRDWTITLVNRRAGELLAVKGDLIGRNHWEEFPAAAQSETFRFHYHQAMEKQVAGEFEVFYPEPFHRWFNISVRPSDDGGDRPLLPRYHGGTRRSPGAARTAGDPRLRATEGRRGHLDHRPRYPRHDLQRRVLSGLRSPLRGDYVDR